MTQINEMFSPPIPTPVPPPPTVKLELDLTQFTNLVNLLNWASCFRGRGCGEAITAIRLMQTVSAQTGMKLSGDWDANLKELTEPEPEPPPPPTKPGWFSRLWRF